MTFVHSFVHVQFNYQCKPFIIIDTIPLIGQVKRGRQENIARNIISYIIFRRHVTFMFYVIMRSARKLNYQRSISSIILVPSLGSDGPRG